MKRNWLKTILASGLCLSLLVGCGGGSSSSGTKKISVNISQEPPEMLSFLNTDSTSGNVLRHVMEGLVTLDENNEAVPGVAKEIPTKENGGISEDSKTITFNLNPDAKWENGKQVTAGDFEFAWDQLFTPENGASYADTWSPLVVGADDLLNSTAKIQEDFVSQGKADFEETDKGRKFNVKDASKEEYEKAVKTEQQKALDAKGWKAVDDTTFTVELTGPYVYFVKLMAFYSFAPLNQEAYEEKGGLDSYADEQDKFLANGPFKIKEWNHEESIVVEKNEEYWNKDAINLDEITFRMISDTNTMLNEFENGTIDMIGLTGDQAKKLEKDGKTVLNYSDGSVWYFEYNTKVKGLNNAKVREALSKGYDVNEYIDKVKGDHSIAATSFTPGSVNNGEFTESLGNLIDRPTDYTEVKALLEEGLKEEGLTLDTFKITLLGDSGDDPLKTYAFFQEQWKKNLGLEVKIQQVEFKTRIANMQSHDFDIVFAGWSADYDDPMSYLDLFVTGGGNNHGQYSSAKYDELVKKALVEADPTVREGYLKDIEKIIATDYPVGTIYDRQRSYIVSDNVTGVVRTAFSDIDCRFADVK